MNELTKEEINAFLLELTELTKKHGVVIWGCGHCGSPWLERVKPEELHYQYQMPFNDQAYLEFVEVERNK